MDTTSALALFSAAIVSTIVLLAIGGAVGYRYGLEVGMRSAPIAAIASPALAVDFSDRIEVCREASGLVADKSRTLAELANVCRESMPPQLKQAIDELVAAAKLLGAQLEQIGSSTRSGVADATAMPTFQQPPPPRGSQSLANLSGAEIRSLTALTGNPSDAEANASKRRYSYDCRQTVYPCTEDGPLRPRGRGIVVRCHDIAPQGISFFWSDAPDFERLIISLGGTENATFMAADVMHSKAVYMHGEVHFLVGCRFLGRSEKPVETFGVEPQMAGPRISSAAAGSVDIALGV